MTVSLDARRPRAPRFSTLREGVARWLFAAGARFDVRDRRSVAPDADLLAMYRLIRLAASECADDRVREFHQEVLDLDWVTARSVLTLLLLELGQVRRPLASPADLLALIDDSEFLLIADRVRRD